MNLVYNAGANNVRGHFVELDPEVYRSDTAITVIGQSEFAHHYGALMCWRGRGSMILATPGRNTRKQNRASAGGP
jgi:uncharacterized protein